MSNREPFSRLVAKLVRLARGRGEITYDALNQQIPKDMVAPERLDELIVALAEQGVEVSDRPGPSGGKAAKPARPAAKPEEPTFASVQAALAEASQPGSLSIYLSSAPMANREEFRDKELQPGEGVVSLSLYYNGGDSDVLSGKYLLQGEVPTIVSPGVRITGGTTLQFVGNPESFVEILARTPNKVCGRFDIHDEWHQMTGEFAVDITPTR